MTDTYQPTAPVFWSRVDVGAWDACWNWKGPVDPDGYGHFRGTRCHRIAWRLECGEIPRGLQVLHTCDRPPCCNPRHLWLGTHLDNMMDRSRKGRQPRGERNGKALLTADVVAEIRRRHAGGERSIELAPEFGVSLSTVQRILNRTRWAHVE